MSYSATARERAKRRAAAKATERRVRAGLGERVTTAKIVLREASDLDEWKSRIGQYYGLSVGLAKHQATIVDVQGFNGRVALTISPAPSEEFVEAWYGKIASVGAK